MSTRKDLEDKFEKLKELLGKALEGLEGYDTFEGEEAESLACAMRRLADTFDIRLLQLPRDVEYVRLKRVSVAMLSQVLNTWARDLEDTLGDLTSVAESAQDSWQKIDTAGGEFEEMSDKILEFLDEHAPEIDVESDLRDAERG